MASTLRPWSSSPSRQESQTYHSMTYEPIPIDFEMAALDLTLTPAYTEPDSGSIRSTTTPLLGQSMRDESPANLHASRGLAGSRRRDSRCLQGWRMGVTLCAITSALVFLTNFTLTVWASSKYGLREGVGTIHQGSCKKTKSLSLWLHIVINLLSTALLGASNYTMQCLTSPTRGEIDKAHARHDWLDIGVPSLRNLRRISWDRIGLWWLLALSSIPLHLLYNSAVFSTLARQDYEVYVASPKWVTGVLDGSISIGSIEGTNASSLPQSFQNLTQWDRLENDQCMQAYAQLFVSSHGNLLAMSSAVEPSNPPTAIIDSSMLPDGVKLKNMSQPYGVKDNNMSLTTYGSENPIASNFTPPYIWICYNYQKDTPKNYPGIWCDPKSMIKKKQDTNWTISGYTNNEAYPIQYCLSQPVVERCKVQFGLPIMLTVIGCNLTKCICMVLALWWQRSPPLVTLGDAIESFLQRVDPSTKDMCLAGKAHFIQRPWKKVAMPFVKDRWSWHSSTSYRRWMSCNILYATGIVLILLAGFMTGALDNLPIGQMWQVGYGAINPAAVIPWNVSGTGGILLTVLVANSPQVVLSFLSLNYNGVITCILVAKEWHAYAKQRKPLRVTRPTGLQRSTYRLQIPYRYGIPLLILSGLLHWLVSLTLFLARVNTYDSDGYKIDDDSFASVGYSPIGMITVILLGGLILFFLNLIGFRKHQDGLPLAGTSSAAISAACHRPQDDGDAALKPVMWGAVKHDDDVGHCCFTSQEVTAPIEWERYSGQSIMI